MRFRIAAEASKISNHDAVQIIVFDFADSDFPECGGLNRIKNFDVEFLLDKKEIQRIPIVPCRF